MRTGVSGIGHGHLISSNISNISENGLSATQKTHLFKADEYKCPQSGEGFAMSEKEELREEGMSLANPFSLSFKDYIFQKMRAVAGAAGKAHISTADLAGALGLNTKVLQEILNGRRGGPDRRDLVIALCAELALDAEETNEALRLYPGSLRRMEYDDARDRAIARFLNAGFDTEICFKTLNSYLAEQGFPELKTRHRNPPQHSER